VDTYTSIPGWMDDRQLAWTFWTVEVIDFRARLLESEKLITGDRYIFLRDAYMQRREFYDSGGVVKDNFSDFQETDEEWEEF
jgi:phospholipid-binding lipoprotein MlaA